MHRTYLANVLALLLNGRVSVLHTRQIIIINWRNVKTLFTTVLQSTGILICLILCRYWSSLGGGKVSTQFILVLAEIFFCFSFENSINSFHHPLRLRMKKKILIFDSFSVFVRFFLMLFVQTQTCYHWTNLKGFQSCASIRYLTVSDPWSFGSVAPTHWGKRSTRSMYKFYHVYIVYD